MENNKIKNWIHSIRGQLIIISISVNILVCIVSLFFVQQNMKFMNEYIEKTRHINDINSLYGYQQRNSELVIASLENTKEEFQEEFKFNMNMVIILLERITKEESKQRAKLRLREIPYLEKRFENEALFLITSNQHYDSNMRYSKYLEAFDYHLKINSYIQEVLSINMEMNRDYFRNAEKTMISTRNTFIIILFVISIFNVVFFNIYNSYLTKPIHMLAKKVKSIGNGIWDIDMSDVGGPKDIKGLAGKIGIMAENIKNLSQDVQDKANLELKLVEEELERVQMMELLKEVQLQGIQMQIKPHFLFNTLNVISRMAIMEGSSKTYELIIALSKFMRHSLKPIKNKITLMEEVDMVTQYLYILKFRMGEHLESKVFVEESILTMKLPIFTLQPIVENAFKHGLEDNITGGIIRIDIRKKQDMVRIRICDNGKGMKQEELADIRSKTKIKTVDFTKDGHIGIENVCYRLNNTYGDRVTYQVTSRIGKGTIFSIRIVEEIEENVSWNEV